MTIDDVLKDIPTEQLEAAALLLRGEIAREAFALENYEHFHWCIFKHELEPHEKENLAVYFEEWNKPASAGLRGVMNKASRGLFKSTDTIGFVLFVIGHNPHMSNLVIQARNEDAQRTGRLMSDIVASNAGWKACFPYVVPDEDRGWALNGYCVKDTRVEYSAWVQKAMNDHGRDPSFMCVSVMAGAIGMHPTGCLVADDIHDSKNTNSLAEMMDVVKTFTADIVPTMTRSGKPPLFSVAYTPWKDDDTYAILEKTGLFRQLVTPAYVMVSDEEWEARDPKDKRYIVFDEQKVKLTCRKVYSGKKLAQQLRLLGRREFMRQLQCTLDVGKGDSLPYYSYRCIGNESLWPMVGGADPTAVEPDLANDGSKRSYFAIAYVGKDPQGGAVVYDGFLEQCSYAKADNAIEYAQDHFPAWTLTWIENVGPGAAYLQTAKRNQNLKVIAADIKDIDEKGRKIIKSKADRMLQMATWFENGVVRIAEKDTPFLNALRYLFDHFWELNKNSPHPAWDAGDAVYAALLGMPDVIRLHKTKDNLSSTPKPKQDSPLSGIGSHVGYGR